MCPNKELVNISSRNIRLRAYLAATHFPQALAMVLLMTIATGVFGGSWTAIAFVFLASATGQATVGWTNDVHDAAADRDAGRTNKPTVRGDLRPDELRVPILVSATLTIPLSFAAAGWIGGAAHIVAVASALVYNFYLARTAWSWLPYALSFALTPVFIAQAVSPMLSPPLPVVALSVLVGVIAHVLNAIPDIDIDRDAGWGGLAVSLGKQRSMVAVSVLVAFAAVSLWSVIDLLLMG
jgi:4-hydroxybenzoate polyprenyltransferase